MGMAVEDLSLKKKMSKARWRLEVGAKRLRPRGWNLQGGTWTMESGSLHQDGDLSLEPGQWTPWVGSFRM
jgi:hypothetical protein